MKRFQLILRGLLAPTMVLAFSALALAAEDGANAAEGHVGDVFKWIHFLILAGIAYWLFTKVLPPYVRRHADQISETIAKATAAKLDAEKRLNEAAAKLATLEHEIAHFREQAQKDASAELERLREMMKVDVDKVRVAAKAEIEAAERAARVELKALAAKLAVDRAESLVAQQMTSAVQDAMITNFVQSLQGRPN